MVNSRKFKKQELNIKSQLDKLKADHEDAIKRLQAVENENKKMVDKIRKSIFVLGNQF